MTNESAIFIELKIVFDEIQPLLEIKFSLFHPIFLTLSIVKCYAGYRVLDPSILEKTRPGF